MTDLISRLLAGWIAIIAGEWGPPRVGGRQLVMAPDLDNAAGE